MKKKNISKKRRCKHTEVISNSFNRKSNPEEIMNAFKSIFLQRQTSKKRAKTIIRKP